MSQWRGKREGRVEGKRGKRRSEEGRGKEYIYHCKADRQVDRLTNRQADRHADRHTDKQTDKQTD